MSCLLIQYLMALSFSGTVRAARVPLDTPLEDLQIPARVVQILNVGEARPVTLERLVTMSRSTFEREKLLPRKVCTTELTE